jgi:hypothetical protein
MHTSGADMWIWSIDGMTNEQERNKYLKKTESYFHFADYKC